MWSGSLWVSGWVRAVWLALSAWIFIKLSAQLLAKSFCKSKGSLGIRGVPAMINWAEGRRCKVSGNAQPSQWGGRSPVGSCLGPCTQTYLRDLPKRLGEEMRRLAGSTEWSEGWKGGTTGDWQGDPAWYWASKVKRDAGRAMLSSGWVVGSKLTFSIQG